MKVILPVIAGSMLLTLILGVNTSILADEVTFSAELEDSLGITLSDNDVTLSINPGASPFSTGSVTSTVYTNAQYGYTLSVSSDSTSLTRTTSLADGTNPTIPALAMREGGYSQTDFTVNSWGYNKGSGNWLPFTGLFELISSDGTTNADTATLNFAVKADYTQPSGVYSISLTFTLIANIPADTRSIADLSNMQDINQDIINNTEPLATKRLIDTRDNNEYQVTKIGDKMWMTEDLLISGTIPAEGSNFTGEDITTTGSPTYNTDDIVAITKTLSNNEQMTWYSFCAAAANDDKGCSDEYGTRYEAGIDICPSGWRLPTVQEFFNAKEYEELNLEAKGIIGTDGNLTWEGQSMWWTASSGAGTEQTSFGYNSSNNQYYQTGPSKNYVISVRCVSGVRTLSDINTMQEITAEIVNNTSENSTIVLRDDRMGLVNDYAVKKIGNRLWMTSNLNTGQDVDYSNSNYDTGDYVMFAFEYYHEGVDASGSYTETRAHEEYGNSGMLITYNFCGVAAGSADACSSSALYDSHTDVCPRHWRLPTASEFESIASRAADFNLTTFQYYDDNQGGTVDMGYGDWWSATAVSGTQQKVQHWDGNHLTIIDKDKSEMSFARCISEY